MLLITPDTRWHDTCISQHTYFNIRYIMHSDIKFSALETVIQISDIKILLTLGGKSHAFHNIYLSIEEKVQKLCITMYALILPTNIISVPIYLHFSIGQNQMHYKHILKILQTIHRYSGEINVTYDFDARCCNA